MISKRIQNVQDPVIPMIGRWIRNHPGTISLGQGVVHYSPPPVVIEAVGNALSSNRSLHGYSDVAGSAELIQLIKEKVTVENGIDPDATDRAVVCTAGANMGFLNSVLAVADVDDEIILLSPYYFNHHMAIEIAGCRVVTVPTDAEGQPSLQAIRDAISPRTRAIVTVSPNNPSGAVYTTSLLDEVNQLCAQEGIYHISDEAYEYFHFDEQGHFSPGASPGAGKHTLSLFSLSKSYGMAGWRVGYSLVPNHLYESVRKIQDTNLICLTGISQIAAVAALRQGRQWCLDAGKSFGTVRDKIADELSHLGTRCRFAIPDGAFYYLIYLDTEQNDLELVEKLISDFGVAALPGSAFGIEDQCAIRISFGALEPDTVMRGVDRISRGLGKLI